MLFLLAQLSCVIGSVLTEDPVRCVILMLMSIIFGVSFLFLHP